MTTNSTLRRKIAKQTNITKLEKLRDTGLDKMVADPRFDDFIELDKTEMVPIIEARIAELQAA